MCARVWECVRACVGVGTCVCGSVGVGAWACVGGILLYRNFILALTNRWHVDILYVCVITAYIQCSPVNF